MKGKKTCLVTGLVFLALFLGSYGQYQLAAVPSAVYETYHLNDTMFSSVMNAPMIPAIFFSVLLGLLSDRCGIKKVGLICMAIGSAGFLLRQFVPTYTGLYAGMLLTGVLTTVFNTNVPKIASALYAPEKMGKVVGILMAGSTASMAVAYGTTAMFPNLHTGFVVTTVFAVALIPAWAILVKEDDFRQQEQSCVEKISVKETLAVSVRSLNVWLMGLALMVLMGGAMVLSNFQVVYLTTVKGYGEALAATQGTVLMAAAILGSIVIPVIYQKCRRKSLMLFLLVAVSGAAAFGITVLPMAGIYACSFLNGFMRSGAISVLMSFPVLFPEIGPKYAGTACGLVSTLQLLGAVLIPTYVVIPLGGGNMTNYFYLAAGCFMISAVLTYYLSKRMN